jgi:plastocyanin
MGPGGVLQNVAVRIAKGLRGVTPAPDKAAVLDQTGCRYQPRVLVVQAGQSVTIKNSDQTLHNVHTYQGLKTIFNLAQVQGMPPFQKKFQAGDLVKFKCDVHPWMTGYVIVNDNPFHAVSGQDGKFSIAAVPAGTYTLSAWHEKYGTQTAEVTVADGKTAEVKFTFVAK